MNNKVNPARAAKKLSFKTSILIAAITLTGYNLVCLLRPFEDYFLSHSLVGYFAYSLFYWLYLASIMMLFASAYRERITPSPNTWTRIVSGIYIAFFACLFIIAAMCIYRLHVNGDMMKNWWHWIDHRALPYMTMVVLWLMYFFYDKLFTSYAPAQPSAFAKTQLALAWIVGITLVIHAVTTCFDIAIMWLK